MADPSALLAWLKEAGIAGLLVGFILSLYKRVLVWGWQYQELKEERDQLRELLARNTVITSKAVDIAEKTRRP